MCKNIFRDFLISAALSLTHDGQVTLPLATSQGNRNHVQYCQCEHKYSTLGIFICQTPIVFELGLPQEKRILWDFIE